MDLRTEGVADGPATRSTQALLESVRVSGAHGRVGAARFKRWIKMAFVATAVLAGFVLGGVERRARAYSSGPPASHTGAPGESNCTACHSSFPANFGLGSVSLGGLPLHYTPNDLIPLTVKTFHTDGFLYGFQVTALDANGVQAGSFLVTDPNNVQLVTNTVGSTSRNYLEQTFDGAFPVEFNQRVWSFSWLAPPTDVGPVTFYIAGNGANGDHETTGDYIYLSQMSFGCTATTPASASFAAAGGNGVFALSSACAWTAVSESDWIIITSSAQGNGNGNLSYTVAPNPLGVARSGSILVGGLRVPVLQGATFVDVDQSSIFYEFIGKLSARGVTLGCGSGYFCPGSTVTREQMAAFIMRALGVFNPPAPAQPTFADVPPQSIFYPLIEEMARRGITLGCGTDAQGNRIFCPGAPVTREQVAAFVIRALGVFNPPTPAMQRFLDVPPTNVFYGFIEEMAVRNITLGCGPDIFCPDSPATREQMAAFIARAFQL
ncbi:MAG: choice-of-anchor V domain-containing protein [Acidobacteriota bacterium]